MNAVVQHALPTIEPAQSTTPMQLLDAAVRNNVDAAQLEKLMDLQERYQANEARRAFSGAMADFQAKCPTILKSKKADRYSYAPLDEVLRTIRPHLDAAGLSIRFNTRTADGKVTAICYVSHRDGHTEHSEFEAPVDAAMKVNETQKVGSANSYAKRYALMNALNLVGSEFDDDGYSAAKHENPDDAPASDDQVARIQEYKDADQIPDVTLAWLEKQETLTVKQAANLITKLKTAQKK